MKGQWLSFMRGSVRVRLVGGDSRIFLNAAGSNRIELWDIAYDREGRLSFWVSVPDFFSLRPILRAAGSRPRVLERRGLPFKLGRLSRRKTFAGGLLFFVAALFALSTLVWDVQVHTDDTVPEAEIRKAAAAEGIRPLQWSPRLPDATELAHRLARRLPDAAWVGVEKSGTRYVINVIRSNKPEVKKESGPSDLIAKADAVVTRIVAESGKPQVARNTRVRKGDTLISGQLGEADRVKLVASEGEVRGLVWYEYGIVSPLARSTNYYTGDSAERTYLVIGNRALQTSGYGQEPYANSNTFADWRTFKWGGWTLPFAILKEKELAVDKRSERLTPEAAREAGLAQARAEALSAAGEDAVIKAEKILHEQTENGKVMIRVLFEIEQSIAVRRPIATDPKMQGE
ncbi:sporulation protein YqfD [Cohnella sp. GCM10012308]|uniref:sporulation protein YqfD n=1 Tax=Cohnella sp. GCM10012308 TaxID=3317329 RepID=UPI00360EAA5E